MYRKNVMSILAIAVCLTLGLLPQNLNGQIVTLPSAGPTAVLTSAGGGPVVSQVLDVSGVPSGNYFQFSLTAQFNPEGANPCFSADVQFGLTSGGTDLFPMAGADNSQPDANVVDLNWSGTFLYNGGDPLSANFRSSFNDAMGPYTCSMSNIIMEIRPLLGTGDMTPAIAGPFNIVSGIPPAGTEISVNLDTSSLTEDNYFFVEMSADWAPGTAPAAFSNTMEFELRDGAGRILLPYSNTRIGSLNNSNPATPKWIGLSNDLYSGGPLTAHFRDRYTENAGATVFNSVISNLQLTFYSIPSTKITLPTRTGPFGPIIGGGPFVTVGFDLSSVPSADYFFYRVRADFIGVPGGGWSATSQVSLNDGIGAVFKEYSFADLGTLQNENNTSLVWTGIFEELYQHSSSLQGGNFQAHFRDNYTDNGGPYTSSLSNIQVDIFTEVGNILPVTLSSFNATTDDDGIRLSWTTESEFINAGFEVQTTSDDDWKAVGFVEGAGTTLEKQNYTYLVKDLEPGKHRFRLKQIDLDGKFEYSPIVEITTDIPEGYHLGSAYPNPFNPQATFTLALAEAQDIDIEILDALGRRVETLYRGNLDAQTIHRFTIDGSAMTSGVYFYRVKGRDFVESRVVQLVK